MPTTRLPVLKAKVIEPGSYRVYLNLNGKTHSDGTDVSKVNKTSREVYSKQNGGPAQLVFWCAHKCYLDATKIKEYKTPAPSSLKRLF